VLADAYTEILKISIFWDITHCSPIQKQQTFQRDISHKFSRLKSKLNGTKTEAGSKQCWILARLTLLTLKMEVIFLRSIVRLTRLRVFISQKMKLFITTAVITSDTTESLLN
jgi:hypothetical protein